MLYTTYIHVTLSKIHKKYLCRKTDCTKKQEEYLCRNIKSFNISIYPLYTVFFWSVVKSTKVIPQNQTTPLTQRTLQIYIHVSLGHRGALHMTTETKPAGTFWCTRVCFLKWWEVKLFCGVWGTFGPSELIKTLMTGADAGLTLNSLRKQINRQQHVLLKEKSHGFLFLTNGGNKNLLKQEAGC